MASKSACISKLSKEIKDPKHVHNGISNTKEAVKIGTDMTELEYTVMDVVDTWVQRRIAALNKERAKLSAINLV